MTEATVHSALTWLIIGVAPLIVVVLVFVSAPYGRHERGGWGVTIPSRLGWIVMEAPAVLVFAGVYAAGEQRAGTVPLVLLGVWQLHYVHRAFVYPFRARLTNKRMPALVALLAIVFNTINAYINARWVSQLGDYGNEVLGQPHLWLGIGLFLVGMAINLHSDSILFGLRKPGETGYKIPRGGLYRWVTNPNYFGETIEWLGWAIAAWSLPALAFLVFTTANLAPRAVTNHRWYRDTFDDYPPERRILIPGLW